MRRLLVVLAAMVIVLLPGTPARAHNQLVRAEPDRDATVAKAPASVMLAFAEKLDPDFATIVVSDAASRRIVSGSPQVDAEYGTVTLTEPLLNGAYTVAYRVVSLDGHSAQGSYTFTVADPALPPAVTSAQPAVAPPRASAGLPAGVLIALVTVGVVLAGGAFSVYASGRRKRPRGPLRNQ